MVALCVATADVGESNDFSPGCIIFAARDSLGVPRRELLRHGSSRLHANPVQVFMRPVLVFLKSEKTFDNFILFHPHKTVKRNGNSCDTKLSRSVMAGIRAFLL